MSNSVQYQKDAASNINEAIKYASAGNVDAANVTLAAANAQALLAIVEELRAIQTAPATETR